MRRFLAEPAAWAQHPYSPPSCRSSAPHPAHTHTHTHTQNELERGRPDGCSFGTAVFSVSRTAFPTIVATPFTSSTRASPIPNPQPPTPNPQPSTPNPQTPNLRTSGPPSSLPRAHLRVLVVEVVGAVGRRVQHPPPVRRQVVGRQQRLHHVPVAGGGGQLQRRAAVLRRTSRKEGGAEGEGADYGRLC